MTKWIKCSDRFPEHDQYSLCWDGTDIYLLKFEQRSDGRHKKRYGIFDCCDDNYFNEITHWMPLPEPPSQD